MLGWLHSVKGVPLHELNFKAALPSKKREGVALAFEYMQWLTQERHISSPTEGLVIRSLMQVGHLLGCCKPLRSSYGTNVASLSGPIIFECACNPALNPTSTDSRPILALYGWAVTGHVLYTHWQGQACPFLVQHQKL